MARPPHRTCQYDGVHPSFCQPFPDGCALCSLLQMGIVAFSLSGRPGRDGRSDAAILRCSSCETKRANVANGATNLARNAFWAAGPIAAVFLMQAFSSSAPLLVEKGSKIFYDMLLFRSFRKVRPPGE